MNVLFVNADRGVPLDGVKGASVHVRQTVHALVDRGIPVRIVAARPGAGVGRDVPVITSSGAPRRGAGAGAAERELRELATSVDLVDAVLDAAPPVDVVYERYSLWSLAGVTLADRLDVPLVVEVNAPLVDEQARFRGLALEAFARDVEATVLRRADAVLCVSRALVGHASAVRGRAEGVRLTPNCVDVDRFRPADEGSRDDDTVVFVGSLKPWHGLDVLVEAFARLSPRAPAARLEIVGEGPERARLERLARELGLDARIRFSGAVDHEAVPDVLRRAAVAVAPYPPMDNFYFSPLKLGEYLAAGVPTVCSDVPGIAEGLVDGESVRLVPPGDVDALAGALADLLDDPAARARIASAGRLAAIERFSLEASTGRLVDLLSSLTSAATSAVAGESS